MWGWGRSQRKESVVTMKGVLVKMAGVGVGDSDSMISVMGNRTCNEGERTVGGRDGDDTETDINTIAVSIGEGDEEEDDDMIGGDLLKGLLSIILSWLGS